VPQKGMGVQVPPRTPMSVEFPQIGHRLNTPFGRVRVVAWTRELAGNLPRALRLTRPDVGFNTPAVGPDAARIPAAGPTLLPTGRQP
jgi:hypothetical protein